MRLPGSMVWVLAKDDNFHLIQWRALKRSINLWAVYTNCSTGWRTGSDALLGDHKKRTLMGQGQQAHTSSDGGYTVQDALCLATKACSGAQYGFATSAANVAYHEGCTPLKSSGTADGGKLRHTKTMKGTALVLLAG